MKFLLFLSNMMIPLIIFYIVGFGFLISTKILWTERLTD